MVIFVSDSKSVRLEPLRSGHRVEARVTLKPLFTSDTCFTSFLLLYISFFFWLWTKTNKNPRGVSSFLSRFCHTIMVGVYHRPVLAFLVITVFKMCRDSHRLWWRSLLQSLTSFLDSWTGGALFLCCRRFFCNSEPAKTYW